MMIIAENEFFLGALRERVAAQGLTLYPGLELEKVAPGRARVSMVYRPMMANILGARHRLVRPERRGFPGRGEDRAP